MVPSALSVASRVASWKFTYFLLPSGSRISFQTDCFILTEHPSARAHALLFLGDLRWASSFACGIWLAFPKLIRASAYLLALYRRVRTWFGDERMPSCLPSCGMCAVARRLPVWKRRSS